MDYKHFGQIVELGSDSFSSPITYYPAVATYSATWQSEEVLTQLNVSTTLNLRGAGSEYAEFWNKRAYSESNFAHLNADVQHTREIKHGFQVFGKLQGQLSDGPLVSSEEFSVGGADTVRGYLESEVVADNGIAGTLEVRSPDLGKLLLERIKKEGGDAAAERAVFSELRFYGFVDGATALTLGSLPDQDSRFSLWSYGIGARFKMLEYLDGSLALAVPMVEQSTTLANEPRLLFSVSGGF
jgi:hemolysin activation/secretion protein